MSIGFFKVTVNPNNAWGTIGARKAARWRRVLSSEYLDDWASGNEEYNIQAWELNPKDINLSDSQTQTIDSQFFALDQSLGVLGIYFLPSVRIFTILCA